MVCRPLAEHGLTVADGAVLIPTFDPRAGLGRVPVEFTGNHGDIGAFCTPLHSCAHWTSLSCSSYMGNFGEMS